MTTISFDKPLEFDRNRFRDLDDFQNYIVLKLQASELSFAHRSVLDERLEEAENNPDNFTTFNELKKSIKRK